MGLFLRPDSPFWWMHIEGTPIRQSTGIPHAGGSPQADREREMDAERVYATTKARHTLGVLLPSKPAISFREYADWYETNIVAHRRSATRERSMLKTLRLSFGHLDIAAIDAPTVQEWMTARRRLKKAPATVNRELDVLKALMHSAVPKYLERSTLGVVRRFRVPEHEPRVLSPDEESRLLRVANADEAAWLILAIDTLLRLSNTVLLQWAQVKASVIVPLNAKVSHDAVPITRRLKDALGLLTRDGRYVFSTFHRGKGETAAKNAAIRRFDELCQKAGLSYGRSADGLTFHCLRHTGATRALQRGASVRTVMKLGGWKGERTVMRYLHATDTDVREAAESIGPRQVVPFTSRSRGKK